MVPVGIDAEQGGHFGVLLDRPHGTAERRFGDEIGEGGEDYERGDDDGHLHPGEHDDEAVLLHQDDTAGK